MTYAEALREVLAILSASPEVVAKGSPEAESEILLCEISRSTDGRALSRLELQLCAATQFPERIVPRLLEWAHERAKGRPLQHVTGWQPFLDHDYQVGPEVLIPRPETEVLVTEAIRELRRVQPLGPRLGLELGLGSGAISIELLAEWSSLRMIGSELTGEARARARANADRILGAESLRLSIESVRSEAETIEPFARVLGGARVDFIISNPPYLSNATEAELEVDVHEPATALYAPKGDSLYFYRELSLRAGELLKPQGPLFMEIPHERASEIQRLFEAGQGWSGIQILPDLTGRLRILIAAWTGLKE